MKAMILAAGFGTRLGDLGRTTPKCLMRAGDRTLLELVIENLKGAGVDEVVINLHHLAERIEKFISERGDFGLRVHLSKEERILGTGGGIKHARAFLEGGECFIVHNADVFSELDIGALVKFHRAERPIASLAVMERPGTRQLLFDDAGKLCGWESRENNEPSMIGSPAQPHRRAFSGIHVLSPDIFRFMESDEGEFSIIRSYIAAARAGFPVREYAMKEAYWIDVGTPERLEELRARRAR
jgi:NDP-sugar pyrophosphorylase family protein